MSEQEKKPEQIANIIRQGVQLLRKADRTDLLLDAITVPILEELRIEAAKGTLSPLLITKTYKFILTSTHQEIDLSPIHKAVYLLFLNHPEGIEFKRLQDYREELLTIYKKVATRMDLDKIEETIDRLIDPCDNAINEKCSRIKSAFRSLMDEYSACYYEISGHKKKIVQGSSKTWYRRLKVIILPRELVIYEDDNPSHTVCRDAEGSQ